MSLVTLSLLLAGACQGGDDPMPVGGSPDAGTGTSSSPDAPKILSLKANVQTLRETEMLVISAVVTDPDGINDLIGGNLTTIEGASAYGAFATDAGEGAYSIALTWSSINTTDSIETEKGAATQRTFRASFFDAAGHISSRDISINLQCRGADDASCSGTCTDLSVATAQHCGACNHTCGGGSQCVAEVGSCVIARTVTQRVACNTQCNASFPVCLGGYAYYGSNPISVACNAVPPATNQDVAFSDMDCYCAEQ
jgi:hypothetical protein